MIQLLCFLSGFSSLSLAATFSDPKAGFQFEYPDKLWEVAPLRKELRSDGQGDQVDKAMAERTLVNVQRTTADEKYHSRFSVVIDALPKATEKEAPEARLKSYAESARKFLASQHFSILSEKGPNACHLERVASPCFEFTASQRDFGLTLRQVIVLKGNSAYLLSVAARIGKFDSYEKEFGQMLSSFHFGEKQG